MQPVEEQFDLSRHLDVVRRSKYLIATFCISAIISSLALTYIFSEKYVASTTILYHPREQVRFQANQSEALGFPTPFVTYESIGNTLESLVTSDAIVQQVVKTLHLDKPVKPERHGFKGFLLDTKDKAKKTFAQAWQLLKYGRIIDVDPYTGAVRKLQANTVIRPAKKAYTFRLDAVDPDPALAAAIVDTEARVLADFLSNENIENARLEMQQLQKQLEQTRQEMDKARRDMQDFKRTSKVSSLPEETTLRLKAVATMEEERTKTALDLQSTKQKRNELRTRLAEQAPFVKYTATTSDNPVVQDLRLEMSRLEVQRSGLLQKLTPDHPQVRDLDAKLQEIKTRLQDSTEKIISSESTRLNDIHQKLLSDELSAEVDVQADEARLAALTNEIGNAKSGVRNLTDQEAKLASLQLHIDVVEKNFKLLSEAYEESRISATKSAGEVAVLHKALIPSEPARPIKVLHVGVTAALSLLLAIATAYFFNYFDHSVRSVADAQSILNTPILSTIPRMSRTTELDWDFCFEPEREGRGS